MNIDPSLLEIIVCPQCRSALFIDVDRDELLCNACALAYPVREGIPVMLVDEARSVGSAG